MYKKWLLATVSLLILSVFVACSENNNTDSEEDIDVSDHTTEGIKMNEEAEDAEHRDMDPSSSGEVPSDLQAAEDPKYPVDSKAVIKTDHMPGMKDAVATITGAFDTTVYTVTYEPTDGGDKVEDHKWVIHEELKEAQAEPYEKDDEVALEADHMEGMKGAKATIDSAKDTIVYMVSYEDTDSGEQVKDHKWVIEEELAQEE